jgi:hypothetical protein
MLSENLKKGCDIYVQECKVSVKGNLSTYSSLLHRLGNIIVPSFFVQLHIFLGRPTTILPRGPYLYTISGFLSLFILVR